MKYRKKPVVVDAVQWHGQCTDSLPAWCDRRVALVHTDNGWRLQVRTLEGELFASPGDWLICGIQAEVYPCKPDVFAATYEAV